MSALLDMRAEFYERAAWRPELTEYKRRHRLNDRAIEAFAGVLGICPITLSGPCFDFDDEGQLAAIIEAIDPRGGELDVVDLVAWPLDRPDHFATALGRAVGLGIDLPSNPAPFYCGRPLRAFRTPLAWLQAGCQGVVILNPSRARDWLPDALGRIAGEDEAHARAIGRLLHPFFENERVVYPVRRAA
jgi:hypothetical protein